MMNGLGGQRLEGHFIAYRQLIDKYKVISVVKCILILLIQA